MCGPQLRSAARWGEWWRWRCSSGATRFSAVFFDVDEDKEREHEDDDDPFTLSIDLLYSTAADPDAAEIAAAGAAEAIIAAFNEGCFDPKTGKWRRIELLGCSATGDEALTYAQSQKLKRWNADYISLRAEPAQPMIAE